MNKPLIHFLLATNFLLLLFFESNAAVLVKLEPAGEGKGAEARALLMRKGAARVRSFSHIGWESWSPPKGMSDETFADAIAHLPGVKKVQKPVRIQLYDVFPNDPAFFKWQWALYNENKPEYDIDAPAAWDIATGSPDIIVAVIDTGIDPAHPDLIPNIWTNQLEIPNNDTDDDGNGFIDDDMGWDFANNNNLPYDNLGHGTHVSGIIGAAGNNGIGICGVNWNVSLLTIKTFEGREATDEQILPAFDYILGLGQKVHVINASWGGSTPSLAMRDAIAECGRRGILLVAAAGNEKVNTTENPMYPGAFDLPNIITVGGSTKDGFKYTNTNFGPFVHICAPGDMIYSAYPQPTLYGILSGTSMAAPHVAGAAALLLSERGSLSPEYMRNLFIGSAKPVAYLSDISLSQGLLNLPALFAEDGSPPQPAANARIDGVGLTTATLSFELPLDDAPDELARIVEWRYSTAPISEENWWNAVRIPAILPQGAPQGRWQTINADRLAPDTLYYFAARSLDEGGNVSPVSIPLTARTAPAELIWLEDFENGAPDWQLMPGFWDVATSPSLAANGSRFLFHPERMGEYPLIDDAVSPLIDLTVCAAPYLFFRHQNEFFGFQRLTNEGLVEVRTEGAANWESIASYKMFYYPWRTDCLSLGKWRGRRIHVRFRFRHVFSSGDLKDEIGWWIDDVRILDARPSIFADWKSAGEIPPFEPPDYCAAGGCLEMQVNSSNTYGFWYKEGAIEYAAPNTLYRARFGIRSDQPDPARAPTFRIRHNSSNFMQGDALTINSNDAGESSCGAAFKDYDLYFQPQGDALAPGVNGALSFDVMNVANPTDAESAKLVLGYVEVERFPIESLGEPLSRYLYTFDSGHEMWTPSPALGAFDAPDFSWEESGGFLIMRSAGNTNCYGFWQNNQTELSLRRDALYQLRARAGGAGDPAKAATAPTMRIRAYDHPNNHAVAVFQSPVWRKYEQPSSEGTAVYTLNDYYAFSHNRQGAGEHLGIAVELINLDALAPSDAAIGVDEVEIIAFPLP